MIFTHWWKNEGGAFGFIKARSQTPNFIQLRILFIDYVGAICNTYNLCWEESMYYRKNK